MSTRARPAKPVSRPPAPRPLRRLQRDAQPIPKGNVFDWRPNVELVAGAPRPARKPQEPGNA
jgi:hypothetical protein